MLPVSKPIITIENVGKRYGLRHQTERPRYTALRDVIAERTKRLFRARRGVTQNGPARSEEFWALRDVSLEIKQGDVVGIIGRNGAGKSTLLKILSRITEPTAGRVRISGRVASLLEVGTGFHPELTGRENIYLNGAILGMGRAEIKAKFDEIVAFAEVERFLDTPVKRYSSGMYVRLAFAVAAHLEPEILVVDEVLAVGDAEFQRRCLGRMSDLSKGGRTVLFVSHNMAAIRSLCSRAALISQGKLIDQGSVPEVIESYRNVGSISRVSSTWRRPASRTALPPVFFSAIECHVEGRQPRLMLDIHANVICDGPVSVRALLAVDLRDAFGAPILQAMPFVQPDIELKNGNYIVDVQIDLPGLIPAQYTADLWLGTHHTEDLDYVKSVISFTIDESPTSGRSFPHHSYHGHMMAGCRCQYRRLENAEPSRDLLNEKPSSVDLHASDDDCVRPLPKFA